MFTFEGVEVGTPQHKRLFSRITDCLRDEKEVFYEEYLERDDGAVDAKIKPEVHTGDDTPLQVKIHGKVMKCRGYVKP